MAINWRHSWPVIIIRTFVITVFFIIGCLSIVFTQIFGLTVFSSYPMQKQTVINLTKQHFVVLLTFITSWVNPCKISITYDPTTLPKSNSFKVDDSGNLSSILTPNSIIIANHQIYTDWLFLWFISYTARLGDSVFIVLKDLSKIPVLGYGMKNFNFLFLSRKWEKDKVKLTNQLLTIDANARGMGPSNGVRHVSLTNISSSDSGRFKHWPKGENPSQIWPYQIIIFPEGTVISQNTKERSERFCRQKNLPKLKYTLLPRTRGLFLTLRKLRNTVEIVYDITTGYSDLGPNEYGENVFTLKGFYVQGYGPKHIKYYIKGWKLKDIPLGEECDDIDDVKEEDIKKFEEWLFKLWYEKDVLMNNFYKYGEFVDPTNKEGSSVEKAQQNTVVAGFKIKHLTEIIGPFTTVFTAFLILRLLWLLVPKFFL